MSEKTAFVWDEKCFWHFGGNYALLSPVGGLVQPLVSGGLPEAPETKRRLKNLMDVSGLSAELALMGAKAATLEDLKRVHPESYLTRFKEMSDNDGGELGLRTPFGPGAFEIAALSAGLVTKAIEFVQTGKARNAYALSRPPGHHCLPEWPNGFCLLANIAIAIEAARANGLGKRFAVLDWDVHHGNGTEAIFLDRDDVLTISIHQDRCYPHDTGTTDVVGTGRGAGFNMNIPLPPGCGHKAYLDVMERLVLPKLRDFDADLVVIACGFDASGFDPLSRMMCSPETYRLMTRMVMDITDGRLVAAHEGGYSELYVPFCGHAMLEEMSGSDIPAEDPLKARITGQQPDEYADAFHASVVTRLGEELRANGVL
ncbi:class II histone deacetylase [Tateyamaria sp. syn59]|uniref:class II histone deacetylase n=1 Tax=Tateyamaria sp. syn59 TaxID=2576942 RepID=UPI0011BDF99E|nr:class II histone deacetylase [Tateyamaria sp. syn59]